MDMSAQPIGQGSFGAVRLATHKKTGVKRAVKTLKKSGPADLSTMRNEINVMKDLDHPHIVHLHEHFEDKFRIHLVMEVCAGGELFDRIIDVGRFTEGEAAIIMKQILLAVFYMHGKDMVHRDLKPENFLFLNKNGIEDNVIKLIDFGVSCHCPEGTYRRTLAGTSFYIAPEVTSGKYDRQCDLWSVGAIMYVLLSGRSPFGNGSEAEMLERAREGRWSYRNRCWERVSGDAKSLIEKMLVISPATRFTAEQALNNEWIQLKALRAHGSQLPLNFVKRLNDFQSKNKLQRAVLAIVASQLSEEVVGDMRRTFNALDVNGDGRLTAAELNAGLNKTEILELARGCSEALENAASSGIPSSLGYTEFLAASLDRHNHLTENALAVAFRHFDLNGDRQICLGELKAVLCRGDVDGSAAKAFIKDADKDNDGKISFSEFVTMMRDASSPCSTRSQALSGGA
jgi:calcium-dependent protein kinase